MITNQEKRQDARRLSQDLLKRATTSKYRFESERYEFRDIIGRGGMGIVLNARDKLLNRDVAVKFLKPELNEIEEARNIFLSEARSMAVLSHANLVSVFDVGVVEDHVMMVMELIEGDDLYKAMHRTTPPTPMGCEEVLRVGIQLCRVVHYMHKQGMIHRDIKPANIIAQNDTSIKLIDFGLTRALDDIAIRETQVRGTPAYMSPEHQEGKELTVTSDIYQIGVTLFELLTTELPFKHQLQSLDSKKVLSVDAFAPFIPEDITQNLIKAMQHDPLARHQSAQELMEALQACYARLSQPLLTEAQQKQVNGPISRTTHNLTAKTVEQPSPQIKVPEIQEPAVQSPQEQSTSKKVGLLMFLSLLILGIGVGLMVSSQLGQSNIKQTPVSTTIQNSAAMANTEKTITPINKTTPSKPIIEAAPKIEPTPTPVIPEKPSDTALSKTDEIPSKVDDTKVGDTKAEIAPEIKDAPKKNLRARKKKPSRATLKPSAKKADVIQPKKKVAPATEKKKDLVPKSNAPSLFDKSTKTKKTKSDNKPSLFTP